MPLLCLFGGVSGAGIFTAQNISSTINNVFNIVFIALGDSVASIVGFILVKKGVWMQNIVT